MKEEIKTKWLTALRSGEYEQGKHRLVTKNYDTDTYTYCCLGVLCDLAAKEGVVKRKAGGFSHPVYNDHSNIVLPNAVQRWAGIEDTTLNDESSYGSAPLVEIDGEYAALSDWNDNGKTFSEIAEGIEKTL